MKQSNLPIHFFTIVLNGQPFINYHLETFKKLPIHWHWHIIEGVANLKHDSSWPLENGGEITDSLHDNGLSNDGTTKILDHIELENPKQVTIYRKGDGKFWDGKIEMINAPLKNIKKECLLWEIDVDEFWTPEQIMEGHRMFSDNPRKFAAFYWCHFFVGPELVLLTRFGYGNHPEQDWQRTWRFKPGFFWMAHEPPMLVERNLKGIISPVVLRGVFDHNETEARGLVFQHFAYVLPSQLLFKEDYYGYKNALHLWKKLQIHHSFPVRLADFLPWVRDETMVGNINSVGIRPNIPLS